MTVYLLIQMLTMTIISVVVHYFNFFNNAI